MKFFRITRVNSTEKDKWAEYSVLGTFIKMDYCKKCHVPLPLYSKIDTEPLQIEWQVISDRIGDFLYDPVMPQLIVLDNVKEFLISKNFEVDFGEVKVLPHKKKRKIPPYPYSGPHLNWLMIKSEKIAIDIKKSQIEIDETCEKCGFFRLGPRTKPIIIPKGNWNGEKIFQIKQFWPGGASYISQEGWT